MNYLKEIVTSMENVPFYNELGKRFSIIEKEAHPQEFLKAYHCIYKLPEGKAFDLGGINPDIYCIVVSEGGKEMFTLNKNNFYYIVGPDGNTIKNVTFK